MQRPVQHRLLHAFSLAVAAIPFAFALIRAVATGRDVRYLWVALAAACGTAAIMRAARRYGSSPGAAAAISLGVFVTSTLAAVLAALLLGTRLGPGILVVGSAFGFCFAVACLLHVLSRP
jgi:hypothetical protein